MASSDDGILERRATSPMGTACLIVAFFMLLLAIIFPILEIGEIRAGIGQRPSQEISRLRDDHMSAFSNKVKDEIDQLNGVATDVEEKTGVGTDDADDPGMTDTDDTDDTDELDTDPDE